MTQTALADLPLEKNYPVAHIVYVSNFEVKKTKNNRQYLLFNIADKTKVLECKKWSREGQLSPEEEFEKFKDSNILFLMGKVDDYNNKVGVVADSMAVIADNPDDQEKLNEFLSENPQPAAFVKEGSKKTSEKRKAVIPENLSNALSTQIPLKNLKEEAKDIGHILGIAGIEVRDGGKGPYAQVKLSDSSAVFDGKVWDLENKEKFLETFKEAEAVYVVGKTNLYNGTWQIIVEDMQVVTLEGDDVNKLYVSTTYDVRFLKRGIWKMIKSMKNEWIRKMCEAFYLDKEFNERFSLVPAGVTRHHSTRNGLLEHTYRLMALAADLVDSYNKHSWPENRVMVDKDLTMAACFLHDAYKSYEYNTDGSYSIEGSMLAHISRCIFEIGYKSALIPNFPREVAHLLTHCVSSHHGEIRFGSPDTPCCPEAIICHYLDNMSSKLDPTVLELNTLQAGTRWSEKVVKALSDDNNKWGKNANLGMSEVLEKPLITREEQSRQIDEELKKNAERKKLQNA